MVANHRSNDALFALFASSLTLRILLISSHLDSAGPNLGAADDDGQGSQEMMRGSRYVPDVTLCQIATDIFDMT